MLHIWKASGVMEQLRTCILVNEVQAEYICFGAVEFY